MSIRKPILYLFICFSYCWLNADQEGSKLYKARYVDEMVQVDGLLNETFWDRAQEIEISHYYLVEKPSDKQKSTFKMVWDQENIYIAFECEDKYITSKKRKRDGAPYFDDCAEIFLTPAPAASYFHCGIEINLLRCSNDFVFLWDYHDGNSAAVKSWNPEFDVAFRVEGSMNDNSDEDSGWTMEMAIPVKLFDTMIRSYPVKEGAQWSFLACRQDRNDAIGDRRSISSVYPLVGGASGIHNPESFGIVKFVK